MPFEFFEIVRIAPNAKNHAGKEGVVIGRNDGPTTQYAVLIQSDSISQMFVEDELIGTGVKVKEEALYDGSTVRVRASANTTSTEELPSWDDETNKI